MPTDVHDAHAAAAEQEMQHGSVGGAMVPSVRHEWSESHKRPYRVCFLIDRLRPAGTEKQLLSLIANLDRTRFQPLLCLLDGEDPLSRSLEPNDCAVERFGIRSLHHFRTARKAVEFWRMLRDRKIDVLQLHFPDSTYFGAPIGRAAGVPLVIRSRRDLGYWVTPIHRHLGRISNRLVDMTVANSQSSRDAVIHDHRAAASSVHVIPNGIELKRYAVKQSSDPQSSNDVPARIGMVANLRPVKDLPMFVRAARRVRDRLPGVRFEIAGDGPGRREIEDLVDEWKLSNDVILRGSLQDIPAFLSTLRVGVLTSNSEGFSNAILEYMAAGLPIVATAVGGTTELLKHQQNGLLVQPGGDEQLARSIERILTDTPFAEQLGNNARRSASAFSMEAMARAYENLYASRLSTSRRRRHRRDDDEGVAR